MKDQFLTNYSSVKFIDRIKESLLQCETFYFSVSFIKKAGLVLIEKDIENALERGVVGKIITSTYQNFTDIKSLELFLYWMNKYKNFSCHLDIECFGEDGFHTKGYLFSYNNAYEMIIGSSNITRFALLKNIEWNLSIKTKDKFNSYIKALEDFDKLWERTKLLSTELIKEYSIQIEYSIEKWDMDYLNLFNNINPNFMQRKALKEIRRYRDLGISKTLVVAATGCFYNN